MLDTIFIVLIPNHQPRGDQWHPKTICSYSANSRHYKENKYQRSEPWRIPPTKREAGGNSVSRSDGKNNLSDGGGRASAFRAYGGERDLTTILLHFFQMYFSHYMKIYFKLIASQTLLLIRLPKELQKGHRNKTKNTNFFFASP